MIYYTAFHPNHLKRLQAQDRQAEEALMAVSQPELTALGDGVALTAWAGDYCIGMAGVSDLWPGRALAWALLAEGAGGYLRGVTKRVLQVLDTHPARRIEATVLCDFEPAHRWVRALGFRQETKRMEAYDPFGRDMSMYVRVR